MTKKDYIAIANAITAARTTLNVQDACDLIARGLAAYAKADNARFDDKKFLAAAKVKEAA